MTVATIMVTAKMATSDEDRVRNRSVRRQPETMPELSAEGREIDLLIGAAQVIVQRDGIEGITIREVLAEAQLATRAFYRHFSSRDELISAVFRQGAYRESRRLLRRMDGAIDPIEGVIAWIDGRLDHAFDPKVAASLRDLALEAEVRRQQTPAEFESSLDLILAPLVDQLTLGNELGVFSGIDPKHDAHSIHDIVWGVIERKWSGYPMRRKETRRFVLRFCFGALGVKASSHHQRSIDETG